MSENMSDAVPEMDWTTPERMAEMTAEELGRALTATGVAHIGCGYSTDGDDRQVSIAFTGIRDAERMVTLAVPYDARPGTFYDRAVASCITLTDLGARDDVPTDAEVADAVDRGWLWTIHPDRSSGRFNWHTSVDMGLTDAQQLTANLNAARLAGGQ